MSWSAGAGSAEITPAVPVMLAGFGDRTEPAASVHDDLEVRALVLGDGTTTVCLLVYDLLGLSRDVADAIRDAVAAALKLPRAHVLTSATHTHAGPNVMSAAERLGWTIPDGYAAGLVRASCDAARDAADASEPVVPAFARAGLPDGISYNRRGHPYDPWLAALAFAREDGSLAAVLGNVAIHPVSLGSPWLQVSCDWVRPFREALERATGAAVVMLSGALGDVNPAERHTDVPTHLAEAWDEATAIGAAAAEAVVAALDGAAPVDGTIAPTARTLTVPATGLLAELLGVAEETVELVEWRLGDVALVGIPGEGFHALGRAITDARGGRALLAGLAPAWHGYLPVPFGDGYEESLSLGADAVKAIAEALIEGAPA